MDGIELMPYETTEASEGTERLAVQALDDATFEPRIYVEETGDHHQAEAIQNDLTAVVETVVNQVAEGEAVTGSGSAGSSESDRQIAGIDEQDTILGSQSKADEGPYQPASSGKETGRDVTPINLPNVRMEQNQPNAGFIEDAPNASTPGKFNKDTGEFVGPSGGMHTESEEEEGETQNKPSASLQDTGKGQGFIQDAAGVEQEAPPLGDLRVKQPEGREEPKPFPYVPRPEEPPPQVEKSEGKDGAGAKELFLQQTLNINPHFADQALGGIGMGPHGMLGNGEVKGMQGKVWGYGPGAPGQGVPGGPSSGSSGSTGHGHKSSGGGAPVHSYGPGMTGKGEVTILTGAGSKPGGTGGYVERLKSIDPGAKCVNSSQGVICKTSNGDYMAFIWNTLDGGNPMPYTGMWSWGQQPKDPGTTGGATEEMRESGHFAPVVSHDGGGRGGGGGGDPSIWDDGNWYGGIFGGFGLPSFFPGDPDGLDYYTPDVIENLTKK